MPPLFLLFETFFHSVRSGQANYQHLQDINAFLAFLVIVLSFMNGPLYCTDVNNLIELAIKTLCKTGSSC